MIITDRNLALMNAIEAVFPKTINLFCRFHINKNVKGKCKEYVLNNMRELIEKLWYEFVRANDDVEYHQQLQQVKHVCMNLDYFLIM